MSLKDSHMLTFFRLLHYEFLMTLYWEYMLKLVKLCTGLFKMIVRVQLSSGNSAQNLGSNHHLIIPFEGGMHSFKRQGACVSWN